jgi:hypothetical protein
MNKFYTLVLVVCSPLFAFSQYCTSVGPTSTADSNVQSVSLPGDGNVLSFIGCPGVLGLQDITNLSTTVTAGSNYSLTVEFGTCGGNYAGKGEIWIDFNSDELFTIDESIGTWSGTPPSTASIFNFLVPAGITNGVTRMRITQQEGGGLTFPLDPCATFQWGSTMDFYVNLTGGMDCSGFIGNTVDDPIVTNTFPFVHNHNSAVCYSNNDFAYQSPDVYYLILPNVNSSSLNVSLCGSSFDTFLSVFDTDGNSIAFNDDGNCGSQSELSFSTVGVDSAYVVVQGWGNESGDYELNIFNTLLSTETYKKPAVKLFPNPVNNQFVVENLLNKTVTITDIAGKVVQVLINYAGETISTMDFNQGIYFVSFIEDNLNTTLKLIVRK